MKTNERIELLSSFGNVLDDIINLKAYNASQQLIPADLFEQFQLAIKKAQVHNGWFTASNILDALSGIRQWLTEKELQDWIQKYPLQPSNQKNVGIIMAGNIPLVGFHDFLCVFMADHSAVIKLSSDDQQLWPIIETILNTLNPAFSTYLTIVEKLAEFDAVIATGSNNSATYFHSYFDKYPNIIRKNRTSIAVLNGDETDEEIKALGKDIFAYFGLGCRNVTQLMIPEGFEMNRFFENIFDFKEIINHHKYANNYDYNKAIYLLNTEDLLDNEFLLLRKTSDLKSPIGVLFYHNYSTLNEVDAYLNQHKDSIQVVIGKNYLPFGYSQQPTLSDYADGIDTMEFLTSL
ncbi:acyl-CoA reductase [Putridiphycobacter roseus]|uniref:Acyl-CoA reductase n=1 Tax=Putridiphycobacter roseus TaxID=2219161 RepID=A0A2W1N386_9FLAO|nr:acyl-CoA reductase [Putridiphycobacter roseus]PZE17481.1 acyl-CoA reductase [Putridiphycobacter roseus]